MALLFGDFTKSPHPLLSNIAFLSMKRTKSERFSCLCLCIAITTNCQMPSDLCVCVHLRCIVPNLPKDACLQSAYSDMCVQCVCVIFTLIRRKPNIHLFEIILVLKATESKQ